MANNQIFSINTYCDQRRRRALFPEMNLNKQRFEVTSPYANSNYTKAEFDMRRKAEVLKYNGNASSTKTNNLTKSELYALAIRGSSTYSTLSPSQLSKSQYVGTVNGKVVTYKGEPIKTNLSASNVPPTNKPYYNTKYLYDDENVPLFMYGNTQHTYAVQNPPLLTDAYGVQVYSGTSSIYKNAIFQDNSARFGSVGITDVADFETYTFNFGLPFSIIIDGSLNIRYSQSNTMTISLGKPTLNVYYSSSLVKPYSNYEYSLPVSSLVLDVSGIDVSGNFSATQYVGVLGINNVFLYTQPSYIYDFCCSMDATITNKSDNITNYNISIIFNPTNDQTNLYSNCFFSNPTVFPYPVDSMTVS